MSSASFYYCSEQEYVDWQNRKTVKCQICGSQIRKIDAYKIVKTNSITGKEINTYYCSEQEYNGVKEKKRKAKEDKDRVYYLICDMFGYEIQNTKLYDEWACWNKLKSNEIIYKYLRENEDYLCDICDKSYKNEYCKIRYFSAVLKNGLADFEPKQEAVKEVKPIVVAEEIYETKYKPKERKGLMDLEEEYDE